MVARLGEIRLVAQTNDIIGEVPLWHKNDQVLYWIDVFKPALHRFEPVSGRTESWTPPEKLGSYALCADDTFLISGRGGMAYWRPATGEFDRLSTPETDRPQNILNDGRTDLRGRFFVASMNRTLAEASGRLWRISGQQPPALMQDGRITIPNSICWSPDFRTFYLGESTTNFIFAYDYDIDTGDIANRRVFADTSAVPGECDGTSVDAEGFLWNARIKGGCVARFAPDGRLDQLIELPVSMPAHITFGGANLRTLYITTATFRMSREQLVQEPMAGGLLEVETDVRGLPEPFFSK